MTPSKAFLSITILLSLTPTIAAWVSGPSKIARSTSCLRSYQGLPTPSSDHDDLDNPCWQDIWSYDCAMSNIYSAAFVAGDWVKSMPCASGLVDCDTPEELSLPGPSAGSDSSSSVGAVKIAVHSRQKMNTRRGVY
eukprot:scaffold1269_cov242-Chaetoceros_neogracile.AAC.3